jgi:enediyne polyketide synthase
VVGHGVGELAGLVWAGCTTPADARALNSIRASVLAAPDDSAPGQLSDAIDRFARFEFRPPRRRLISGCTGTELAGADQVPEMLSAEVFDSRLGGGRLAEAVRAGAVGATLLLQTSQDPDLREAVGQVGKVPAVAIDGDPADSVAVTRAIAALFAAGAIGAPAAIAAGRPARPIDIWREQVFITNPCQIPLGPTGQQAGQDRVPAGQSDDDQPGTDRADQPAAGPDTADRAAATGADQATGLATLASLATRTGPASLTGTVEEPGAGQPPSPVPVASVTPWARCYVEQLRQPGRPVPAADQGAWRIYSGGCESLRPAIETAFRRDPAARRTLAVLGPLDAAGTSEAALRAAQDAIESGILVAICAGPDLTGLWASLHAEHPSLGITVIRAPMTSDGIAAAAGVAAAGAGEYRELAVDASGAVREPVMAPVAAPGDGSFPLGPEDVVLVSRAAGAAGLALAQVIACSGAAIAIIGGRQARQDEEVIATLEQLRQAGARVSYEAVDTADRTGMLAAIRRIEGRLGPITAVGHAVAGTPRLPVADLTAADLDRLIRAQTLVLDQIVSAIRAAGRPAARTTARTAHGRAASQGGGGLRLIATFGSVVGRYGLAGESVLAVASQALAEHGERLAVAGPGCAALHIDWPGWAQDGLGERADLSDALRRAGFAPMSIAQASRLLLKVLASGGLPARLALHGRVGIPAPRVIARTDPAAGRPLPGRFLGEVLAHYPGAELIAEATLTLASDPYLADYRLDGAPVFPLAMALEAMAQAASALAGATLRAASRVELTAPVVLPTGPSPAVTVRVFALWLDDAITVVLRSDQTGYEIDHVRAVFAASPAAPGDQGEPEQPGAGVQKSSAAARTAPDFRSDGTLDASMLYGPVWFQAGRFRRLAAFRPAGSRSATAVARGADGPGWFGPAADGAPASVAPTPGLILGSAAIGDACLQVVQGCVPHRRLAPAGCDTISWSGLNADGLVTISARQSGSAARDEDQPAPPVRVPRPRSASAATTGSGKAAGSGKATGSGKAAAAPVPPPGTTTESCWDVEARDATGRLLVRWQGLRMRDAGPLPRTEPWPAELLGSYLEHAAAELGLGPGFEVRVARLAPASAGTEAEPGWVTAPAHDEGLAALRLRVRAAAEAGCAWQTVRGTPAGDDREPAAGAGSGDASQTGATARPGGAPLTWLAILEAVERAGARGPGWTSSTSAGRFASTDPAATRAALAARARALAACLGPAPAGGDVTVETRYVASVVWLLLRSGDSRAASVLLAIDGVDDPVVLALRAGAAGRADQAETGLAADAGTAASRSSRRRKRAAAARTSGS